MEENFKKITEDMLNKPFKNLFKDGYEEINMKNEIFLLDNIFDISIINQNENKLIEKDFLKRKIQYNIDDKLLVFKSSSCFVSLPTNLKESISSSFILYVIKKTPGGDGAKDILYINKYEFNDIESEFNNEGLKFNKGNTENDIGKEKDISIDKTIGITKSPSGR